MPQLDTSTFASQLFWLFVSFVAFYVVISCKVVPLFDQLFGERERTSSEDIQEAEVKRNEAEAMRAEYEKALSDARQKASSVIQEASRKMVAESEKMLADVAHKIETQSAHTELALIEKKSKLSQSLTPVMEGFIRQCLDKIAPYLTLSDKELELEYQKHRHGE